MLKFPYSKSIYTALLILLIAPGFAQAKSADAFKKITKAPSHADADAAEEAAVPVVKPAISTEPAPGTHVAADNAHHEDAHPGDHAVAHHDSHTPASTTPTADTKSVDADTSLRWLTNGNTRFVSKNIRNDGRSAADRQRLTGGQHPHAIVLSCADSRVPPEIVFDQELGEIFTIRVAGEALDSSVIASIEYAVEHLHPHLLVVMGHTQCGAVDATLKTKEGESAGSENLDKLVADIRPRLHSVSTEKPSPNLEVESTVNADGVARDLVKRSDIIRKHVEAGDLVIKPALYRMDSGKVKFY